MTTKTLGNTNLQTPPIMFGGNVFGWTLDEKESFRMLDMLFERGFTFIDTADVYGKEQGLSEQIIGKWMKNRKLRNKITLATKGGRVHRKSAKGNVERGIDNSKPYLLHAAKKSLERLQTDYIDLYYTHFDDGVTPVAEVLEALHRLIESGIVCEIGASNYKDERLKEALTTAKGTNLPKYEVFQTEYNLLSRREFEKKLREICEDYQVSVATYFSLASGFLTGKYRKKEDFKGTARQQLTEKYFTPKGLDVLNTLDKISEAHNTSNAAVALAWILHRPNVTTCVVSATKPSHLDVFEEALALKLSIKEMNQLCEVSDY